MFNGQTGTLLHGGELEDLSAEQVVVAHLLEGTDDLLEVHAAVAGITAIVIAEVDVDVDVGVVADSLIQILLLDVQMEHVNHSL